MLRLLNLVSTASLLLATAATSASPQWKPMPNEVGSVLRYRLQAGGTFEDSISRLGRDTLVMSRWYYNRAGVPERRVDRRFISTSFGIALLDVGGAQPLFPQPWPSVKEWSYARSRTFYRFVVLADTTWVFEGSTYAAQRVQLTVEAGIDRRIVRYLVVENFGIVSARSVPDPLADDYELIDVRNSLVASGRRFERQPAMPPTDTSATPPTPSTNSRPVRNRNNPLQGFRFYLGGSAVAGSHGTHKPPSNAEFQEKSFLGGAGEVGFQHYLGARGKFSKLSSYSENSERVSSVKLSMVDVSIYGAADPKTPTVFVGVGRAWFDDIESGGSRSRTWAYLAGIRGGGEHAALNIELSYFARGVPKQLADVSGVSTWRVEGDLWLVSIGLRFY